MIVVAFKIVARVLAFRMRRLEMANLAATISLALALHLRPAEFALRAGFALALNVLVYLNNDWNDIALDLRNAGRDQDEVRYLALHARTALWTQILLGAALFAVAVLCSPGLLIPLLLGGGVCIWYSATLKRHPGVDILAMAIWGAAMPVCGAPTMNATVGCLVVQLGLFSSVFQTFQLLRDASQDAAAGIRSTAVFLGQSATLWLLRALMLSVSVYAAAATSPWVALLTGAALVIPEWALRVESRWTLTRLIYGASWLVLCVHIFLHDRCAGLAWTLLRGAGHG